MAKSALAHRLVVIGGSKGAQEAFCFLAATLPPDLPAAFVMLRHRLASAPPIGFGDENPLHAKLRAVARMPVLAARDGEPLCAGTIYLPVGDRHLVVDGQSLRLVDAPPDRHWRPSIDRLYASAAASFGRRTVAVTVSGELDDGVEGLHAIAAAGGMSLVQEPQDAEAKGLPWNAITRDHPDWITPLHGIVPRLNEVLFAPE